MSAVMTLARRPARASGPAVGVVTRSSTGAGHHPRPHLYGRQPECDALDRLASTVQAGHSAVLVLRGEAGVGKTALLDHAQERAAGCRIVRVAGVEAETALAFSGLHQLCAPFLDHLCRLPGPQRDALAAAFGMADGAAPDRFLVGLAVLGLLTDAAQNEPLVWLVDDAQWLDQVSAGTLAFVARRLRHEPVGLVLAVREPHLESELASLRQLAVGRLTDHDARALLTAMTPGRLDERVRDRIVAETHGNPRALLELPLGLTPAELAGGFGLPEVMLPADEGEQHSLDRVRSLPETTQRLLLVAAAEPIGDVALLARAAELLGVDPAAVAPAEAAGLVSLGTRVRFADPHVRAAAYHGASAQERQEVHRALADATDASADPERRAWHLAGATAVADEEVAAELERWADRAQVRGGVAAAAAFLDRAASLTPDPARRSARALAAARAMGLAGAFDVALDRLAAAELSRLDAHGQAEARLLRGQITLASTSAGAALPALLSAARNLEALDRGLAHEAFRDALNATLTAGELAGGASVAVAEAALAAPPTSSPGRNELLVNGVALMVTEGYAAGMPLVQRALTSFRADEAPGESDLAWLVLACRTAHNVWDFEGWTLLSGRLVDLARTAGALAVLPSALELRVANRVHAGDLATADALLAEAAAIDTVTGSRFPAQYTALLLEPWRGGEAATYRAIDAVTRNAQLLGEGKVETATQWASAVLYNGLGRYDDACAAAERGCEHPEPLGGPFLRSLVELVEAASRSGRSARAADAAWRLDEIARAAGTEWALGTAAGARAQVSEGSDADALYREALERLGSTDAALPLARSHLRYGEWLHRENRRVEAREQLGTAYELLAAMGAEAFAERARRALNTTADAARRRTPRLQVALTPQEAQIARLAGDGLTNPEIAAQLFISPHTVEWHLRKVFQKLGIASRRQIGASLLHLRVATA